MSRIKINKNLCPFLFATFIVSCFIIYNLSIYIFGNHYLSSFPSKKFNEKSLSLINNTNRFEWYQTLKKNERKGVPLTKAKSATVLHAYKFEYEFAVVIITPWSFDRILYCRYFDNNFKEILPVFESITVFENIVYCEKRNGVTRISLSVEANGIYDFPVPFIDRTQKEVSYELSYCISPVFGDEPKWLVLLEQFEHYKLQGVTHFYFYLFNITNYDMLVIGDYMRTGELELIILNDKYNVTAEQLQVLMYEDCLLRSRGHSKWSIFVDIDEFLLMTNYKGTILDYIRENEKNDDTIGAFLFRQQWLLKTSALPKNYQNDKQIEKEMLTRRYHNSTGVAPIRHTSKCIVNPKKVLSMSIHNPVHYYPGFKTKHLTKNEGVIRHFRDQKMNNWGEVYLKKLFFMGKLRRTSFPSKYSNLLTERVKKRASAIYAKKTEF